MFVEPSLIVCSVSQFNADGFTLNLGLKLYKNIQEIFVLATSF